MVHCSLLKFVQYPDSLLLVLLDDIGSKEMAQSQHHNSTGNVQFNESDQNEMLCKKKNKYILTL